MEVKSRDGEKSFRLEIQERGNESCAGCAFHVDNMFCFMSEWTYNTAETSSACIVHTDMVWKEIK